MQQRCHQPFSTSMRWKRRQARGRSHRFVADGCVQFMLCTSLGRAKRDSSSSSLLIVEIHAHIECYIFARALRAGTCSAGAAAPQSPARVTRGQYPLNYGKVGARSTSHAHSHSSVHSIRARTRCQMLSTAGGRQVDVVVCCYMC